MQQSCSKCCQSDLREILWVLARCLCMGERSQFLARVQDTGACYAPLSARWHIQKIPWLACSPCGSSQMESIEGSKRNTTTDCGPFFAARGIIGDPDAALALSSSARTMPARLWNPRCGKGTGSACKCPWECSCCEILRQAEEYATTKKSATVRDCQMIK